MPELIGHAGGTGWDEWMYVVVPLLLFAFAVIALTGLGRPSAKGPWFVRFLVRIPGGLQRLTGLPGWVAATVGTGVFALLVAVIGFYWDVAWHIDFGRDKEIFTPPHTLIVVGLLLIVVTALVEVVFATLQQAATRLRWKSFRIPYSALPLAALGIGALIGFPLDDVWHHFYGVDVTMWGPTHLIMIAGASFTPVALWLVLAEAGIRPNEGAMARLVHVVLAVATLTGLSTFQGEFDFGVPQFQLLYHPVLIAAAAGAGLVAARLVLGPGGAVIAAVGFIALRTALALLIGPALGLTTPQFPLYLTAAIGIEIVTIFFAQKRSIAFAVGAGLAVGTFGVAGEWAGFAIWGRHAWTPSLFPHVVPLAALAAVAAAVLATAMAASADGRPLRFGRVAVAAAALGLLIAVALPFPRTTSPAQAGLNVQPVPGGNAVIRVQLDPPDAASDARWFETIAWQGGGLRLVPMVQTGAGRYVTKSPVPVTGNWKTLVRLHRGSDLMGVPVYMPADPEIGAREIPLADRSVAFTRDTALLMRESKGGPPMVARTVYAGLAFILVVWVTFVTFAAMKVRPRREPSERFSSARASRQPVTAGSRPPSG